MASGWFILNPRSSLPLLYFLVLTWSCSSERSPNKKVSIPTNLNDADVVCRLGTGYFSNYFRLFGSKEKVFSHVGLILMEDGVSYVYHSEASEFSGIGSVKKEKLEVFLQGIDTYDYFTLTITDSEKGKIAWHARNYLARKVPFDLEFNNNADDALYCTEFVANCINKGLGADFICPNLQINYRPVYGLDDIYLAPLAKRKERTY